MPQLFTNNARALLVSGIGPTDTSMVVESASADLFPIANTGSATLPTVTDWFKATLQDSAGLVEIVYVRTRTAGSGVLASVMRGQEGTTARSYTAGTVIGLRVTALDIQTALAIAGQNNTFSGVNTFSQPIVGSLTGNAGTVTNGVYTAGDQSIAGVKTFTGQVRLPNGSATTPAVAFSSDGAADTGLYWTTDGSINFANNGVYGGAVSAGGNLTMVGNVTAYSDERLKKDWATLPDTFVYELAKVKYGTYTRIDTGERQAGSSAQDWQKLLPEVVLVGETLSLAYGNAALVSVVKLAQKVVELETRLAHLEA